MFGISIGSAIAWLLANAGSIETAVALGAKYVPQVIQLAKEGYTAVAAARQAAPDLVPHIKQLAGELFKSMPAHEQEKTSVEALEEHVARGVFMPGWTDDETRRWWDGPNLGL